MKKSNYQKLQRAVAKAEGEIRAVENRLAATDEQTIKTEGDIKGLTNDLEAALLSEDAALIASIEEEISSLRKLIERNKLLKPALENQIEKLREDLGEAEDSLDVRFSELAQKWLTVELKSYDRAATALQSRLRKLLVCSEMLRERGLASVFHESIGPGHQILNQTKIPTFSNFNLAEFNSRSVLSSGKEHVDEVYQEITK